MVPASTAAVFDQVAEEAGCVVLSVSVHVQGAHDKRAEMGEVSAMPLTRTAVPLL